MVNLHHFICLYFWANPEEPVDNSVHVICVKLSKLLGQSFEEAGSLGTDPVGDGVADLGDRVSDIIAVDLGDQDGVLVEKAGPAGKLTTCGNRE